MESDNDNEDEYLTLITRAQEYQRSCDNPLSSPSSSTKKKSPLPKRNSMYLKCKAHTTTQKNDKWSQENTTCSSCLKYEIREEFRPGLLPLEKDVLEYLLTLKSKQWGKQQGNATLVSKDIKLHWVYCNVYTLSVRQIKRKVDRMYERYDYLKKVSNNKKKGTYWTKYSEFIISQNSLFDVLADKESQITQGKLWGVMMAEKEFKFYDNQSETPQVGVP